MHERERWGERDSERVMGVRKRERERDGREKDNNYTLIIGRPLTCRSTHFSLRPLDPWLHCILYES